MKFEIYPRKDGTHGLRLVGNNGEIVMSSEGYNSKGNAHRSAKRIKEAVADAEIVVLKEEPANDGK